MPDWVRKTSEVMPSEMGVQLRYGPMRMPVLGSVGVDKNG